MEITERQCKHPEHVGDRILPTTEFNRRGNGYQSYCKSCQKTYSKKHYDGNKNYYAEKRDSWRGKSS